MVAARDPAMKITNESVRTDSSFLVNKKSCYRVKAANKQEGLKLNMNII